jgi:hypothetical protein
MTKIEVRDGRLHIEGYPTADRLVVNDTQNTRAIEDFVLHAQDLNEAFEIGQLLGNIIHGFQPEEGPQIGKDWIGPLWIAVVQKYYGCFSFSARTNKLDPRVVFASRDPLALENHYYFENLRNKHFVHDVNSMRQTFVGAVLESDGTVVDILRLCITEFLGIDEFQNVINLISAARDYVNEELDRLVAKAWREIEALTPEERLQLPLVQYTKSSPKTLSVSRANKRRRSGVSN